MGKKQNQWKVHDLTRFLLYVLGRRPDEFGLVPDRDGFFPIKELIQALHEEAEWRHIRRSHIHEVLMEAGRGLLELEKSRIRAVERGWRIQEEAASLIVPRLLFTPVRRRAHPVALDRGLTSPPGRYLVLSSRREMAYRIGQRRDPDPVLIEVMASDAHTEGFPILAFGELFLSSHIPAGFITGPPVPKDMLERTQQKKAPEETRQRALDTAPGSFFVDFSRDAPPQRRVKGRKPKGWKEEARKSRKR